MPHPQSYTIRWLSQGQDIYVSHRCHLYYDINPIKDKVSCDVSPLEFYSFLLGKTYMWKHHIIYESRPRCVITPLGGQLYKIPEVVPITAISLVLEK